MVCLTHKPTFNIFHMGPFLSVEEVEALLENNDNVEVQRVAAQFNKGKALGHDKMCKVLNGIKKIFILKLTKKGVVMHQFGSDDLEFVDAMGKYKVAVMNFVDEWQEIYEKEHGDGVWDPKGGGVKGDRVRPGPTLLGETSLGVG